MFYTIRKIIVPIDMSETSLNALNTAIALAQVHHASVFVLNIIEPNYAVTYQEQDLLNVVQLSNSKDVLQALIGSIQHSEHIKPMLIQKEGCVADCIIATAISEQADLIVMGTHGASGYRSAYIGSNTYTVMKHAECPVLSIPPRKKFSLFNKALYPIRPVSGALANYNILFRFLTKSSTINVLGLYYRKMERETKVLNKIVDEIDDNLRANEIQIHTDWGNGNDITDDVLQYTQQQAIDLIVVTNVIDVTTKTGFIGPHAQRIINCSKVPVLSLKGVGLPSYV